MFLKTLIFSILLLFTGNNFYAAELEVNVKDLKKDGGFIMIGISKTAGQFDEKTEYFTWKKVEAVKPITRVMFDLPSGNYAVSLYHDDNSNGKLDTGAFGKPKESYGFSNNIFGSMGKKPAFEQALIVAKDGEKNIVNINVR